MTRRHSQLSMRRPHSEVQLVTRNYKPHSAQSAVPAGRRRMFAYGFGDKAVRRSEP